MLRCTLPWGFSLFSSNLCCPLTWHVPNFGVCLALNMSDQYLGQRMVEEEDLGLFLEAYEEVTGEALRVLARGERPDFICARPMGERVGVELTRPHHDYHTARWDRMFGVIHASNDFDLLDAVSGIVAQKSRKRMSSDWRLRNNTILVIKLVDYAFLSPEWFSEECLADDYASAGFAEIWLADHTELDAYGAARLIGLHPERIWGTHHQPSFHQKPYG